MPDSMSMVRVCVHMLAFETNKDRERKKYWEREGWGRERGRREGKKEREGNEVGRGGGS